MIKLLRKERPYAAQLQDALAAIHNGQLILAHQLFTAKAMDEIHKASAGIPRMINRVCEKSLMYAFQQQKRLVDDYMVKYVVEHEMLGTRTAHTSTITVTVNLAT